VCFTDLISALEFNCFLGSHHHFHFYFHFHFLSGDKRFMDQNASISIVRLPMAAGLLCSVLPIASSSPPDLHHHGQLIRQSHQTLDPVGRECFDPYPLRHGVPRFRFIKRSL
jgi:hypothetical protein